MKDFGTSESPKSTRSSTTHWCPGRPGHPAFRHNIASSLRLHTGLPYDWTPRSDAPLGSPLAPSARRVSRVASRLPGTTRLRFALHGGQRMRLTPPLVAHLRLALSKSARAGTARTRWRRASASETKPPKWGGAGGQGGWLPRLGRPAGAALQTARQAGGAPGPPHHGACRCNELALLWRNARAVVLLKQAPDRENEAIR